METLLTLAVQKSGRLYEDSLALLADCGLRVPASSGKLKARAAGFGAEIFFLRDDDIPQYVADGVADVGIVGRNVILEKFRQVKTLKPLDFGRCRLSLAVKADASYTGPEFWQGKRIATSYTRLLTEYLLKQNVQAEIHEISGSVEIAPSVGMADGICDLVSSGSTLLMNGLREVEVILHSEAEVIASPAVSVDKQVLIDELLFRIDAVLASRNNKYILLNAPNEKLQDIINVLPGVKSPTVMPLALEGWSSLHSVISEKQFWESIGRLKQAGAQGILVIPIEKMIV